MTKFQFFESGYALAATRLGLISPAMMAKYDIYKTYLENLLKTGKSSAAKKLTMKFYNCHYSTMVRAIYFFEEDYTKANLNYKSFQTSANNHQS